MKRVSVRKSELKGKYTLNTPKFRTIDKEGLTHAVSNLMGRKRR